MLTVSDNHIVLGGGGGSTTFAGLSDKATADIPAINTPTATALNARELLSNKKTNVDANKTSNTFFPSVKAVFDWVSGLFVKGAASSTDNAIARFDGATGKLVQNSTLTIADNGVLQANTNGAGVIFRINSTLPIVGDGQADQFGIVVGSAGGNYGTTLTLNQNDSTKSVAVVLRKGNGSSNGFQFTYGSSSTQNDKAYLINRFNGVNYNTVVLDSATRNVGIGSENPAARLDVNGTFRSSGNATFNAQIIDNTGSSGTDGQVLKKVGGLVRWSNP